MLMTLPGCDRRSTMPRPDLGPRLHEMGRPAIWQAESREIAGTRFKYSVGPSIYQDADDCDPDYYSIDVEFENGDGSSSVYFQRDFRIQDLPPGFLAKKIDEIATFDPQRSAVVFRVGEEEFVYQITKIKDAQQDAP
jgi:hypothetical protein